jgi:hypothetical protein
MNRFASASLSVALFVGSMLIFHSPVARAQDADIDADALIDRILANHDRQREALKDVTFESQYVEGEETDKGFVEKVRFNKKVYIKYLPDTAWYHEEYLEYYKENELQSARDCYAAGKERTEKKQKRKSRDISYDMVKPFFPAQRSKYEIGYKGLADEKINDRVCHHFVVRAREDSDQLINGDYYFEGESFNLVRVDFSPAKLVKSVWFKLNRLDMSVQYAPNTDGYWLPSRFSVVGKGKATLFIGVNFGGTEFFRNPVVNSGLDDKLFEADHE